MTRLLGGGPVAVVSPATGEVIGAVPATSDAQLTAAVDAAEGAFRSTWARDSRSRAHVLHAWADQVEAHRSELARLLVLETGKLAAEADFEIRASIEALRYNAGMAAFVDGRAGILPDGSAAHLERQPVGVTAFITPWNWPVLLLVRDLAPALAAGVTAVIKPADPTPFTTREVVSLAGSAGMPKGVLNVVHGGADVGRALVEHPGVRAIAFTGSTNVGKDVMRAAAGTMRRVLLELGGKGSNLVFADADVASVIPTLLRTAFITAGQMCMATTRILVHRTRYDDVLDALVERVRAMRVGDPFDDASEMGPLISQKHRESVSGYVAMARASARVITGGDMLDITPGAYLSPAVVTDVRADSPVVQHEIFGPVVTVEPFDDDADAIRLANAVPFGLVAGVWTRDVHRAWATARALDVGTVWVNGYMRSFPEMPSGGFKESGLGRTRGVEGIEQFTELKHINWAS